jgi:glycosyltransferase involved in cell wall biosynthesis
VTDATGLRVLFWMREAREIPGGHRMQMQKTAAAVRALGADVSVSMEPDPSFDGFDIVHGFFLSAHELRRARRAGCMVALSTIYNPIRFTHGLDRPRTPVELMKMRGRSAVGGLTATARGADIERAMRVTSRISFAQKAYECADLLLPNAEGELADLRADLDVSTPAIVVPNAVDEQVFLASDPPPLEGRQGVLCVGRIEPHKNQLGLAEACRELGVPLTIVGPEHPHHPGYVDRCRRAYPALRWVPECDQQDLVGYYDAARVHALCSWFETTGLSSLEAAARGCSIVSTSRGYAHEYFGEGAHYCDPADARSVVAALRRALHVHEGGGLAVRVRMNFTWAETARQTLEAYASMR